MPYPKAEQFEFTLEDIGAPEYKVVGTDPSVLPWSVQRRAQQAQFIMMRLVRGNQIPGADEDWALTVWDEVMRAVVVSWNLPYPDGHPRAGEVIPLDGSEPDPWGALPTPVWGVLVEEVGKRLTAAPKRAK